MTKAKTESGAVLAAGREGEACSQEQRYADRRSPVVSAGVPGPSLEDEIVGNSSQIRSLKQLIDRIAPSDASVLITGETGTGKELFARRLHKMSNRRDKPMVSVNCAAIPDALLESELFGFEKGAFTGAFASHLGTLAQANGGTLFLDEVGDLSLPAQAKLLRAVEEREIRPLGSRSARPIDIRLIAATNRDLWQLSGENKFRQDLFFRLNIVSVCIPPLSERAEDIPSIANHLLQTLSFRHRRPFPSLTPRAQCYMQERTWVGNVRELRNVIERLVLLSSSSQISEQEVADVCYLTGSRAVRQAPATRTVFESAPRSRAPYRNNRTHTEAYKTVTSQVSEVERLRQALEQTKWNKSKAAKLMHCSRMTIYRKLVQYELSPPVVQPCSRESIA